MGGDDLFELVETSASEDDKINHLKIAKCHSHEGKDECISSLKAWPENDQPGSVFDLYFIQQLIQVVETVFPELAERIQPFGYLLHFCSIEVVVDLASGTVLLEQMAFRKYADMFRDSLAGNSKMFS